AQKYAEFNRKAMIDEIVTKMDWKVTDQFTTIHNYIDMENMILRKGAISAQKDERVIIPINMRDGSIIAFGKGNPDWNFSGPHGAGRIMSRKKAKELVSLE
ncbi:RtcB family protein, partial [Bacillus toyonensis]|uniref:RtcB family protein n=1 Tax=Bacillus toyonensis TaxID=155322 RepID=UPI000BECAFEC